MKARKGRIYLAASALFCAVLVFAFFGTLKLGAATPVAGSYLTNIAVMSWSGGSTAVTNRRYVGQNYGGVWIGEADKTVASGSWTSNVTSLTNYGNGTADYVLTSRETLGTATVWTNFFSNENGGAHGTTITAQLSAFGVSTIVFYVGVPVTETNGAFKHYMCLASNSIAAGLHAVQYVGSNGTTYGGQMGKFGAPEGAFWLAKNLAYSSTNWVLTVNAPVLTLTKSMIQLDNPGVYTTDPVPGARLTYKLIVSNRGAAAASSVWIVDRFKTDYVTYVVESMKFSADSALTYDAASLPLADAAAGDAGAWTNGGVIYFTPNGTTPLTAGGALASHEGGTYYYRVTVN